MTRALLVLMIVSFAPSQADAQSVAVSSFDGPRGRLVRNQVVSSLQEAGVALVDSSEGIRVEGRVSRARRSWRADIRLRDASGAQALRRRVRARNYAGLRRAVRRFTRRTLALEVESLAGSSPASVVDAPVEDTPEPNAPESDGAHAVDAPTDSPAPATNAETRNVLPIAFSAGLAVTHRSFGYEDDIYSALRPYSLPAAPLVRFAVEYFPGAHAEHLEMLAGLSIVAQGEVAAGVQSTDGNGTAYPTDAWGLGLLARYQLRIDEVALGIDAGYQTFSFGMSDADELTPRPNVPNVEYHTVRAGASFRWDIGLGLFFSVRGAYLHPFTGGEITSEAWFPRAEIGGFDGEGGIGLVIGDVELSGRFSIRRFWYAMNPEPGDARVAGGAVDQYFSGVLGVVYRPSGL